MAKKKTGRRKAQAGTQSQLRDSKGVNAARDGRRTKGGAVAMVPTKSAGTARFRKGRRVPE